MAKHIDLAGLGHTGKEALSDFFREFDIFAVPKPTFEFNLFRIPGGLIDLKKAIYDNWSIIRSNNEYERFQENIIRTGYKASIFNLRKIWLSNGFNYEEELHKDFIKISNKYLESLVLYSDKAWWPFKINTPITINFKRLLRKIGYQGLLKTQIRILDRDKFLLKTRNYMDSLFKNSKGVNDKTLFTISHNAFDPSCIDDCLQMFNDGYSILVVRDPRDIYASLFKNESYTPNYDLNKFSKNHKESFLMANTLKKFIARQKLFNSSINSKSNKRHLKIWFEDLVLNYDQTLQRLSNFLNVDLKKFHKQKRKFFNPSISKKNVFLWKKLDKQILEQFDSELKEFYYPG